ncbi:MAG: PAS domain S-box protein [Saprospiraceae bacterium]
MANLLKQYWGNYAAWGTSNAYVEQENAKIRLMNKAYIFCLIGFSISFLLQVFTGYIDNAFLGPFMPMLVFAALPFLSYWNRPKLGWHIASIIIPLGITFAATQRPILYANYLIYGTITFLLIYLHDDNKKIQLGHLIFTSLNVIAFAFLSQDNPTSTLEEKQFPIGINITIILIALIANYLISYATFFYRRNREKELGRVISLKNAVLNATKDATLIVSRKGKITGYNRKYIELWELETEVMDGNIKRIVESNLSKLINKEEIIAGIKAIEQNPSLETFHVAHLLDGRVVECHTQPQIYEGRIVGRGYNYRDITEKHNANKKLAVNESLFRSFFEDSPLGIALLDNLEAPFHNVNQKFCDMFGYTSEEISELKLADICSPDYLENHVKEYDSFSKNGQDTFSLLNKYRNKTGEVFWGNVNFSTLRNEHGEKIGEIVMVEDINEKKLQEEKIKNLIIELKLLNEQLEKEVKVRTVDLQQSNLELRRSNQDLEQFAYIASHDLQEPLRMVGNFVQLLERQYQNKVDEEGKEYIKYIVDGVNRLSKLIQNLLKYSRVGRRESALRTINLGRIVEAKLFGLKRKIEETGATVIISDMPSEVYCEPDQIGIVFYNLMTNAIKFNTLAPKIEIGFEDKPEALMFFVKDNGIGIDKRYETKVFEIFKRLHRREDYEGTGIGLALCKKIIARHGGKIWFESAINEGTEFYFTISKSLINEKYVPLDSNLVG